MYTLKSIAEQIGGELHGNGEREVRSICPLESVEEDSIVFVRDQKHFALIEDKKAASLIVDFHPEGLKDLDYIHVPSEKKDAVFIKLLSLFEEEADFPSGISERASLSPAVSLSEDVTIGDFAVIGENTAIGNATRIGAQTVIGKNCTIGRNCTIYPRVTIYPNTRIDDGVIIHSGVVIGSDGFGYTWIENAHCKIPQIGGVHIERNVEIGANTCIDRGTLGYTKIGEGTKIDNLVQIAHNVEIGKNSIICGLCGISGSVKIGNNVILAGMAGLADHIVIEDDVIIGAKSGVMERRVKRGSRIFGIPTMHIKDMMEFYAMRPKVKGMYFDLVKIKKKLGMQ